MNKTILVGAIVVVGIGLLLFALKQPEPTPEEKLAEAAEEAAGAVGDAVAALGDAAQEAGDALSEGVQSAVTEAQDTATQAATALMEQVSASAQETKDGLQVMLDEWQSSGIVTETGVDYEKAQAAIEASSLSDQVKAQAQDILQMLRDAPEQATALLSEIETALTQ